MAGITGFTLNYSKLHLIMNLRVSRGGIFQQPIKPSLSIIYMRIN